MLSKKHAYTKKKLKKKKISPVILKTSLQFKIKSFHINVFIMIPKSFY